MEALTQEIINVSFVLLGNIFMKATFIVGGYKAVCCLARESLKDKVFFFLFFKSIKGGLEMYCLVSLVFSSAFA